MRALVLGGTGFIGRFVVPLLQEAGHTVAVFHRSVRGVALPGGVLGIRGDRHDLAASANALRAFAPQVVIDMIASSGAHGRAQMETFRDPARRVVVISSMDVYRAAAVLHGLEPGPLEPLPLTEDSALRTVAETYPPERLRALRGAFGWVDEAYDKVAVERAVLGDPTVLRLPMVYGPGDPLHRFHPMVKRILDGRTVIPFDARVAQWRAPRGYVENVAAAIVLAATSERPPGQADAPGQAAAPGRAPAACRVYNVAEAEPFSELEWARLIADAMGWHGRFVGLSHERAPKHLQIPGRLEQHWAADTSRIRAELGYAERVSRAEAIRRTIEWERAHPPVPADPAQFDYAAEDAAIGSGRCRGRPPGLPTDCHTPFTTFER